VRDRFHLYAVVRFALRCHAAWSAQGNNWLRFPTFLGYALVVSPRLDFNSSLLWKLLHAVAFTASRSCLTKNSGIPFVCYLIFQKKSQKSGRFMEDLWRVGKFSQVMCSRREVVRRVSRPLRDWPYIPSSVTDPLASLPFLCNDRRREGTDAVAMLRLCWNLWFPSLSFSLRLIVLYPEGYKRRKYGIKLDANSAWNTNIDVIF